MGPNNTQSQMATNEPNDLAALPPTVEGEDMPAKRKATTSFKITNVFLSRPPSNDGDQRPRSPTIEREEMPADGKAASFKILRVFPTASNDSNQRAATNKSSFKITNVFKTASNDGNKN